MLLLFVLSAVFACKSEKKGSESPATNSTPTNTPPDNSTENENETPTNPQDDDNKEQLPDIQLVVGGEHNCVLIHSRGTIKCWGSGSHGQLGNGKVKQNIGDEPGEMGSNLTVIKLGGGHTAKAVSAGGQHTCAILDNNEVKCWGNGKQGRLGQGNEELIGDEAGEIENLPTVNLGNNRTARAISAGSLHTCALLDNGAVKCWGLGKSGRLGQGNSTTIGDKENEMGESLPAIDFGNGHTAQAISAGWGHTCAILNNGAVKCWGSGSDGRLGQGNTTTIGDGKDEIKNLAAINLGTGRTAKAISAGWGHTCAILNDGAVKCWGNGSSGKLGYGDTARRGMRSKDMGDNLPEVKLGTKRKAKTISAGLFHTCALLDDNTAKCWGSGGNGMLGTGSTDSIGDDQDEMDKLEAINFGTDRTVKAIAAGVDHTCALLDNNTVKCFGFNGQGQLGSGNTDNLGDSQNETGDSLPVVDLGF